MKPITPHGEGKRKRARKSLPRYLKQLEQIETLTPLEREQMFAEILRDLVQLQIKDSEVGR